MFDRKMEKYIDKNMWQEKQDIMYALEEIRACKTKTKRYKEDVLELAESIIIHEEEFKRRELAHSASKEFHRLSHRRKLYGIMSLLLLCVAIGLSILASNSKASMLSSFRFTIASLVKLDSVWIECDEYFGLSIDFTTLQSSCDTSRSLKKYFLYNITNALSVLKGQVPIVEEIGPFEFKVGIRKTKRHVIDGSWLTVDHEPYHEYLGDESLLNLKITTINMGFTKYLAMMEHEFGFKDMEVILLPSIATTRFHNRIYNIQAGSYGEWIREDNSYIDCQTLGCFLDTYKFDRVVSATNHDLNAMQEIFELNMDGYPVFGVTEFTAEQIEHLWSSLIPGSRQSNCTLPSMGACASISGSIANAKIIIDAFRDLWSSSWSSFPILSAIDLIRLENAKTNGDISSFSEFLWTRDSRCRKATEQVGGLTCSQLNDVAQYLHWLFKSDWTEKQFMSRTDVGKGIFTTQTVRTHLLTGFEDATLAIASLGSNASAIMDMNSHFQKSSLLNGTHLSQMAEVDTMWLQNAWVPPIVNTPSIESLPLAGDSVFPGTYFKSTSSDTRYVVPTRTYFNGSSYPRYLKGVRALDAIDDATSINTFGQASSTTGHDQLQLGPSLDVFLTGNYFQPDGTLLTDSPELSQWKSEYSIWSDLTYRATPYTHVGSGAVNLDNSVSFGDDSLSVGLDLMHFKMKYDRFKQFLSDRETVTCLVNVSALNNQMPVYVGYPNYLTCNSTQGETPEMEATAVTQQVGDLNNGFAADTHQVTQVLVEPQEEAPLPLNRRAQITNMKNIDNNTMNVFLLEPVTGHVFHHNSAVGVYVSIFPTSYLFPSVPSIKLPYYSTVHSETRSAEQARDLASELTFLRTSIVAFLTGLAIAITCSFIASLVFGRKAWDRPELDRVKVMPVEGIQKEALHRIEHLLAPSHKKLIEYQKKYEESVSVFHRREKKLKEIAMDIVAEEIEDSPEFLNFGLTNDGSLFKITNQEVMDFLTSDEMSN